MAIRSHMASESLDTSTRYLGIEATQSPRRWKLSHCTLLLADTRGLDLDRLFAQTLPMCLVGGWCGQCPQARGSVGQRCNRFQKLRTSRPSDIGSTAFRAHRLGMCKDRMDHRTTARRHGDCYNTSWRSLVSCKQQVSETRSNIL